MFSRSKARHVKRFLYEDSEEDSDPPPEYVYFLISLALFNYYILLVSFNLDFIVWLKLN